MTASISNIHRVKNFVTSEQISEIITFAEAHREINKQFTSARAILQFRPDSKVTEFIQGYQSKVEKLITDVYGKDVTDMAGTTLRKWYPGEFQAPHADCEAIFSWNCDTWEMSPVNNFSSIFIEYAALTYLNDDYEGGEIYFPDHELEIKPATGELIFFPGTQHYSHGVREVLSGNRYAMMTFFTTPKLQYLWRKFVIEDKPLQFVDYTPDELMQNQIMFDRSNIPQTMTIFGQRFSHKPRKEFDHLIKPFGN